MKSHKNLHPSGYCVYQMVNMEDRTCVFVCGNKHTCSIVCWLPTSLRSIHVLRVNTCSTVCWLPAWLFSLPVCSFQGSNSKDIYSFNIRVNSVGRNINIPEPSSCSVRLDVIELPTLFYPPLMACYGITNSVLPSSITCYRITNTLSSPFDMLQNYQYCFTPLPGML